MGGGPGGVQHPGARHPPTSPPLQGSGAHTCLAAPWARQAPGWQHSPTAPRSRGSKELVAPGLDTGTGCARPGSSRRWEGTEHGRDQLHP